MSKEFRIMIVDDSPQDIHMLFEELRHEYQVVAATSASDALTQLAKTDASDEAGGAVDSEALESKPNVILLDVNMPNMDGYEACKKIKENPNYSDIDIIFLSANDSTEEIIRGLDVGAVDYIVKPYDPDILHSKLKHTIDSSRNRMQLKQQAEAASTLVRTVLSESGSLANVVSFLRTCLTLNSASDLVEATLEAFRDSSLNAVVYFNLEGIKELGSTSGDLTMLEAELMQRLYQHDEPFFEKGRRLFVAHKHSVILIKNTPDDQEKLGTLKDYAMILLEGINAKLEYLSDRQARTNQLEQSFGEQIIVARKDIDGYLSDKKEHNKLYTDILDGMVDEVENSFASVGLTDKQEEQLLGILSTAVSQSFNHLEKGMRMDESICRTIDRLV